MIHQDITDLLRFVEGDEVDCRGNLDTNMPCIMANGKPAYAIHLWNTEPVCSWHSPVGNIYVPCTKCGEKPALRPESVEEDPLCRTCLQAMMAKAAEASFLSTTQRTAEWDVTQPEYAPFGSAGRPKTEEESLGDFLASVPRVNGPELLRPRSRRRLGPGCEHI